MSSWKFDAPAGVYKNHALSSDIRREASRDSLFMRFVRPERGYGKGRGEAVTITRVMQLGLAGKVSEVDRLPSGRPAIDTKSVTPGEYGFKIEVTQLEQDLTHFNMRNVFQQMLRDQMRLTMDKMVADAYKLTPIKFNATSGTAGTFATGGTFAGAAAANLTIDHLRLIFDYMRATLVIPPFRNGNYVGILSTKAARGIKNDSKFETWFSRAGKTEQLQGPVTRLPTIEGFDLFETNHVTVGDPATQANGALHNDIGTADVAGEAIFFGMDAAFLATVRDPELRAGLPEDLGRFQEVGWVGNIEAGLTWDTASRSRTVHFGSLGN